MEIEFIQLTRDPLSEDWLEFHEKCIKLIGAVCNVNVLEVKDEDKTEDNFNVVHVSEEHGQL